MRVIICGAGQVGYGIAERLASEGNDISVIDMSPELIEAVGDTLDVRTFVGHGAHPDVLETAGAEQADMIIAVTLYDEVNIVACEVAHALFNVPTKIARIRAQSYLHSHYQHLFSREHMPIDVIISPELEVGEMVLRRIALPGVSDVVRLADDKIAVLAIECLEDCPVVNTQLAQLTTLFPDLDATVIAIVHDGELSIAHSDDQLASGDTAYVATPTAQIQRTLALFGHEEPEATRIVIAGGGNIGLYVAQTIEARQPRTKIKLIEASLKRASRIADRLHRSLVLHGSALDQRLLHEAEIEDADLIVALTNDDQVNMLAGVMAKRLGCKSDLVLINNPDYLGLTKSLGIDAHISPRSVTISRVLQHVRRGRIRAVHSVQNGKGEIIEAEALETSPMVGAALRDLDLPEGIRIGAVFRGGQILRPDGDLRVKPQDRVVLFATAETVKQVEQMFRVSLEFF